MLLCSLHNNHLAHAANMTGPFETIEEIDPAVGKPDAPKKGNPPVNRTPQNKKQLSYAKDRRNTYGENDKASRKNIPLSKARESRDNRRKAKQLASNIERMDEVKADLAQNGLIHGIERIGGWKKVADTPLGTCLADREKAQPSAHLHSRRKHGLAEE